MDSKVTHDLGNTAGFGCNCCTSQITGGHQVCVFSVWSCKTNNMCRVGLWNFKFMCDACKHDQWSVSVCVCVFSKGFENAWNHKYGSSNNREHWILPHTVEYHFFEYLSTTCQHAIETTKAIGSHGMNAVPPSTKLQLHQRPAHQTIHFTSPNPWILWICFGSSFNPSNNTKIQTN